jgi:hypothetical protein
VLRWDFGAPHESYLAFRCDPFVGRYINIENSFQLHARGRPLILTPNSRGFEGGEPFGSRAQNKISFQGVSNYEHFWGQLGVLEDSSSSPRQEFASVACRRDRRYGNVVFAEVDSLGTSIVAITRPQLTAFHALLLSLQKAADRWPRRTPPLSRTA